jgi:hypothetical protein
LITESNQATLEYQIYTRPIHNNNKYAFILYESVIKM